MLTVLSASCEDSILSRNFDNYFQIDAVMDGSAYKFVDNHQLMKRILARVLNCMAAIAKIDTLFCSHERHMSMSSRLMSPGDCECNMFNVQGTAGRS